MERHEIIKLSKKNIELEDFEKAKKILEQDYLISHGKYEPGELKKAINDKSPVIIEGHLLIGFDKDGKFVDHRESKVSIDRMVKAVIIEGEKELEVVAEEKPCGDVFAIIGRVAEGWDVTDFRNIFGSLRVGTIFLPPHSAIFNFLEQTEQQKKDKIVSMLAGVNINIYSHENYVDNCIHETGHLFWRDCLTFDEKQKFKEHFKFLRPSAIYEFKWETKTEEEAFCTIYKWYVKSILIHRSFYNILEFEEPDGLKLLQCVFDRIAKEKMVNDIWSTYQGDIMEYLNPRFDVSTGKYIRKVGALDRIKDIELPRHMMNDINRVEDGVEFINLGKAVVPVRGGLIAWESMEKARVTKYIRREPKAGGGWNYVYKEENNKVKIDKYINSIYHDKDENSLCLDGNGNVILHKIGDSNRVRYTQQERRKMIGAQLHIHNHPNGSTFSGSDLLFGLQHKIKKMIVATERNNKKIEYHLDVLTEVDGRSTKKIINDFFMFRENIYNELSTKVYTGEITSKQAEEEFDHKVMYNLSKKYKEIFKYEKK